MLDQAFDALKKFNFGSPLDELRPIEDAVVAAHEDEAVQRDLEQRLISVLGMDVSRDARDYACRKLAMIGTPAAVPALTALLPMEGNSHLARHALERIPGAEAARALADAAVKLSGRLQLGAIGSLGARRDPAAVEVLAGLLNHADAAVCRAAALSLGMLGGAAAATALQSARQAGAGSEPVLVDALLACAESLRMAGQPQAALGIYKQLSDDGLPRLVRLAATRGILACRGEQP